MQLQPFTSIQRLPQLLAIRPTLAFIRYEEQFNDKFNVLKAYESPLPTQLFLQTQACSATAMLSFSKVPVDAALLRHLPALRLIVTLGTGFSHVDMLECRRRGISVANTADAYSEDTADAALGLLIDVLPSISAGDRFLRRGLWPTAGEYRLGSKLGCRRAGLVGFGNIGSNIAKRLAAFGCTIAYTATKKKPSAPYQFHPSALELALHSNVLIICCALNEQTHHIINKDVLKALGKDGILINVGRGPHVDEKELVKCLLEGDIAGAGLDVFENEPDVPKELFELDNVVMTLHRAGLTEEAVFNAFKIIMANLVAFFSNEPLLSPVR